MSKAPDSPGSGGLSGKALRFQSVLDDLAPGSRVREFEKPSRTAQQAADAVGCLLNQIVKSLLLRTEDGRPVLALTAGGNRVDEEVVGGVVGSAVRMADADFVRAHTGYAIGGVPPFGHPERVETLVDEDLLVFDEIWAAAGTPNTVFAIAPARLLEITGGRRIRLA